MGQNRYRVELSDENDNEVFSSSVVEVLARNEAIAVRKAVYGLSGKIWAMKGHLAVRVIEEIPPLPVTD